jgi:hypothetical protein
VAFTLCYLGLRQILGLLRSSRRTETDKDIEIMVLRHQVRILERQLNARRLSPCGSGDPRHPLPVAGAMALALLPRHARDAPSSAPRALEAQMAVQYRYLPIMCQVASSQSWISPQVPRVSR